MSEPETKVPSGLIEIEIESCYTGRSYKVKVDPKQTVRSIKEVLDSLWDIPSSKSVLLFEEKELDNHEIVQEMGIIDGSKLTLLVNMTGGPLYTRRIYTTDDRRLKDAVEKSRKELSKKYPSGARVLVILHQNAAGHYKVMRIFDAIQDGNDVTGPLRPKSPSTPPNQSSPCKLIKYRKSIAPLTKVDPSKLSKHEKVTEKDHWVVIGELVEERKMKFKINTLRDRMNEVRRKRRSGKSGLRKFRKFHPSYPLVNQLRKIKEHPIFFNRVLHFKEEFDYPTYMASYYDKRELTSEMKGYKHITFRVVVEEQPSEADGPPMILYNEGQALQESCRKKACYMIIKPREYQYDRVMRLHKIRLRLESDYLELALRRRGFSQEEIEDFVLEFFWSGDVSYRFFLARTGLAEMAENTDGLATLNLFEKQDFNGVRACYKRSIYEIKNPEYGTEYKESTEYNYGGISTEAALMLDKLQRAMKEYYKEFLTRETTEPKTEFCQHSKQTCMCTHRKANDLSVPPSDKIDENDLSNTGSTSYHNITKNTSYTDQASSSKSPCFSDTETAESVDEENAESEDEENAESVDEENAESEDEENAESVDEENAESEDEENTESVDEENAESVDEENASNDNESSYKVEPVSPSRRSQTNTYRRASGAYLTPSSEIAFRNKDDTDSPSENTYRRANDSYLSPSAEVSFVGDGTSSDFSHDAFLNPLYSGAHDTSFVSPPFSEDTIESQQYTGAHNMSDICTHFSEGYVDSQKYICAHNTSFMPAHFPEDSVESQQYTSAHNSSFMSAHFSEDTAESEEDNDAQDTSIMSAHFSEYAAESQQNIGAHDTYFMSGESQQYTDAHNTSFLSLPCSEDAVESQQYTSSHNTSFMSAHFSEDTVEPQQDDDAHNMSFMSAHFSEDTVESQQDDSAHNMSFMSAHFSEDPDESQQDVGAHDASFMSVHFSEVLDESEQYTDVYDPSYMSPPFSEDAVGSQQYTASHDLSFLYPPSSEEIVESQQYTSAHDLSFMYPFYSQNTVESRQYRGAYDLSFMYPPYPEYTIDSQQNSSANDPYFTVDQLEFQQSLEQSNDVVGPKKTQKVIEANELDSSDSSKLSSPDSSTSEDSSSESDEGNLVIDLEGGGDAQAEMPADFADIFHDDTIESVKESEVEISVPTVDVSKQLDDEPEEEEAKIVDVVNVKEVALPPVEKVKKIKCAVCKRRLNITNMWDCRCGNIYCAQHRYAELHQCSFDYRKNGRDMIAQQNPRIVGEKLRKI